MRFDNHYFTEEQKYKLFVDMDSVLTDWVKAYEELELSDKDFDDWRNEVGAEEVWKQIENKGGIEFWAEMDWMPDGKELWEYVKKYNPTILSTPADFQLSIDGKEYWLKDNIGDVPYIFEKDKSKHAIPNGILIDDYKKKTDAWEAAGGIAILHTSTEDTIKQLKELGL